MAELALRHRNHAGTLALDLPGQLAAIGALGALAGAIIEGGALGFEHPSVIAAFVAAAVLAMLFVWREGRAVQPMLPLFLFSHRLFILTTIVGLLVNIAIYGLIFVLSLYFQRVAGLHASLVVSATVLLLAAAVIGIGVASRDQTM